MDIELEKQRAVSPDGQVGLNSQSLMSCYIIGIIIRNLTFNNGKSENARFSMRPIF